MFSMSNLLHVLALAMLVVLCRWSYRRLSSRTQHKDPTAAPSTDLNEHSKSSDPIYHTSWAAIETLLNPKGLAIIDLLSARAIPNKRLIHAFNLSNTFVSEDPDIHTKFRAQASQLLQHSFRRGWSVFFDICLEAVDTSLPQDTDHDGRKRFDTFIQTITLRVVLAGLLCTDRRAEDFDAHDLEMTASLISKLWSLSKVTCPDPALLSQLNVHLHRLFGDHQPFENPLDFVIPSWETLWRVVAMTVASTHQDTRYRVAFSRLRAVPTEKTFKFADKQDHISPQSIITEVLRLHPPSRHIHRITSNPFEFVPLGIFELLPIFLRRILCRSSHEVADIEKLHRSQESWGLSSDIFNPMRHEDPEPTGDSKPGTLLAFGGGPLQCVAKKWAPIAAAFIAAAVLDRIGPDSGHNIVEGDHVGGRDGWDGWFIMKVRL
ncbi:hypothetical protein VKT23_015350 [Stygiomarasmius scandens]|uniref:Cytochrome P450 n=1 Tax=Marasmiellus scandens TaxID=2682957 RepID=A0ABR1J0M4_9AGAR